MDDFIGMQGGGSPVKVSEEDVDEGEIPHKAYGACSFWDPILGENETEEKGSKRTRLSTKEDELKLELQRYTVLLKKLRPEKDSDPLIWWRARSSEFPLMAQKAYQFLSIPATSVDCERLFSIAGIAYGNKRRGRLSGQHARLLLMIKAHENKERGRECKAWSRWEVKRYSASQQTESQPESSDDDEEPSSSEEDGTDISEEFTTRSSLSLDSDYE